MALVGSESFLPPIDPKFQNKGAWINDTELGQDEEEPLSTVHFAEQFIAGSENQNFHELFTSFFQISLVFGSKIYRAALLEAELKFWFECIFVGCDWFYTLS